MTEDRKLREKLRQDGYRVTQQRQILLDEMKRIGGHPTAKDVYDAAKKRIPALSLGTVYRNLKVLETLGLIKRLTGDGSDRYDVNPEPHCHITCLNCGRIADARPEVHVELSPHELEKVGFRLTGYHLVLYGICSQCQSHPSSRNIDQD